MRTKRRIPGTVKDLHRLSDIVAAGIKETIQVGLDLAEIKADRLYLLHADSPTWAKYCTNHLGHTRLWADRLIAAAKAGQADQVARMKAKLAAIDAA